MAQSADNQTAVQQHMAQIMSDIDNSIHRTARYLQSNTIDYAEDRYIVSEQSLYLGHPFHPTPKSASGFSEADLEICTRMSYIIQLHYLAVHQDVLLTRYVEGKEDQVEKVLYQLDMTYQRYLKILFYYQYILIKSMCCDSIHSICNIVNKV